METVRRGTGNGGAKHSALGCGDAIIIGVKERFEVFEHGLTVFVRRWRR